MNNISPLIGIDHFLRHLHNGGGKITKFQIYTYFFVATMGDIGEWKQHSGYDFTHPHAPLIIMDYVIFIKCQEEHYTCKLAVGRIRTLHFSPLAEHPAQLTNWCNGGSGGNTFTRAALKGLLRNKLETYYKFYKTHRPPIYVIDPV